MKTISAREAKNAFGLMIDTARAEPVLIEKHGWGVVIHRCGGIWGLDPVTAWPLLSAAKGHDLRPWLRQADRPGVIVGVLPGGRVHSWCSQGRGGIDEDAAPLTPTTAFYAASVSKQFTASCVATCVAAGELDVGNSVRSYIPELPTAFDPCDASCSNFATHFGKR